MLLAMLTSESRYLLVIFNATKNPRYQEVARDIVDALLVSRASSARPAIYRPHDEQERRLEAVYKKYSDLGDVWSAAAPKVCIVSIICRFKLKN